MARWAGGVALGAAALLLSLGLPQKSALPVDRDFALGGPWEEKLALEAGQAVSIHVRLAKPEGLPANGRMAVEWKGPELS